jgi:biotin-[acetyl-CoA-carboxylase] ligase BirA-like protein
MTILCRAIRAAVPMNSRGIAAITSGWVQERESSSRRLSTLIFWPHKFDVGKIMFSSSSLPMRPPRTKPPNVLFFCCDDTEAVARLKTLFRSVLAPNKYTLYGIGTDDLVNAPWQDNAALLVVSFPEDSRMTEEAADRVRSYVSAVPDSRVLHVADGKVPFCLSEGENILSCNRSEVRRVLMESLKFSVAATDQESPLPPATPRVYVIVAGTDFTCQIESQSNGTFSQGKCTFNLTPGSGEPEMTLDPPSPRDFDAPLYLSHLKTSRLGRTCLFTRSAPSSFDLLNSRAPFHHGLAVVVERQTSGKGRGGNEWLSPPGCAMFSMQIVVPLKSALGQRLPLLQHLAALAVVHGINRECGDDQLLPEPLRVKWPNDIYVGRDVKVGGVLAFSSICGGEAVCNIGVGFNLDNREPTVCLNRLLKSKVPREVYFALVFNALEELMDQFEGGREKEVYALYYSHWLHSEQKVEVTVGRDKFEAVVDSIDDYGFLRVVKRGGRKLITLQDDGNSFDMMRGLIAPKMNK